MLPRIGRLPRLFPFELIAILQRAQPEIQGEMGRFLDGKLLFAKEAQMSNVVLSIGKGSRGKGR